MGQLSDPYKNEEDEGEEFAITLSGLPEEPEDPPADDDIDVDMSALGIDEDEADDADAADDSDDEQAGDPLPAGDVYADLRMSDADDEADDDESDEDDVDEDADEESGEEVAYDLSEWDDDQLSALADALEEAGVAHAWEDDELYVRAEDEQLVDGLLEEVTHPHALPEESDDGDAGGALLGELFVVADRLIHDPEEHEAVALLLRLANAAEESDPPYGLAEDDWNALRERVEAVAEELEVDDPNLDEVIGAATDLRNAIRPYV